MENKEGADSIARVAQSKSC